MFYLWLYFMDVANLLLFLDALTSLSLSLSLLNCMSVLMILTIKIVEPEGKQMQLLLNVGGPDRVSRVQMAEAVADFRGYNTSLIKPVSASSVCIAFKI